MVVQESCRAWMLVVLVMASYLSSLSLPRLAVPALCLRVLCALSSKLDCPDVGLCDGLRRAQSCRSQVGRGRTLAPRLRLLVDSGRASALIRGRRWQVSRRRAALLEDVVVFGEGSADWVGVLLVGLAGQVQERVVGEAAVDGVLAGLEEALERGLLAHGLLEAQVEGERVLLLVLRRGRVLQERDAAHVGRPLRQQLPIFAGLAWRPVKVRAPSQVLSAAPIATPSRH